MPGAGAPSDLPATLERAWALLARGAVDRRCVAHTPTLATLDARRRTAEPSHGGAARLRGLDPRTPYPHRSAQSEDRATAAGAGCALHLYDAAQNLQPRVRAIAQVRLDDALAAADQLRGRSEAERCANFAVLVLRVIEMDVLVLAASGHLRAYFT